MSKRRAPTKPHPMQPIVMVRNDGTDRHGVVRFQQNSIVRWLLDEAQEGRRCDLNRIATQEFHDEDHRQFAQLIGYSVSGYGSLSYVQSSPQALAEADRIAAEVAAEAGVRTLGLEKDLQKTPVHSTVAVICDILAPLSDEERLRTMCAIAISLGIRMGD